MNQECFLSYYSILNRRQGKKHIQYTHTDKLGKISHSKQIQQMSGLYIKKSKTTKKLLHQLHINKMVYYKLNFITSV